MNFVWMNIIGWSMLVVLFTCLSVIPFRLSGMSWPESGKAGFGALLICASLVILIHTSVQLIRL